MDAINNSLNELINKDDINVRIINLSNELLETLKLIENCTSCKKDDIKKIDSFNYHCDELHKLINEIESEKVEQKKIYIINQLNDELIKIDDELNRKVL